MRIKESKRIIHEGNEYTVYKHKFNEFGSDYAGPRLKPGTKTSDYFWSDDNSEIECSRIYNESIILDSYVYDDLIIGSTLSGSSSEGYNVVIDSKLINSSLYESFVRDTNLQNIRSTGLVSYKSNIYADDECSKKEAYGAYFAYIKNFNGNAKDIHHLCDIAGIEKITRYKSSDGYLISLMAFEDDDVENAKPFMKACGKSNDDYSFIKGYWDKPELHFRTITKKQLLEAFNKYGDIVLKELYKSTPTFGR